jgi:uncharacterized protein (TIGR00661 family)
VKILYAIQGTGNGHITRAEEIAPILSEYGKVDLFVSGSSADIKLSMQVKYKSKGLSFFFGKKGGIDLLKTFKDNSSKRVMREIKEFPVEKYDLVVNDFEAITAWACHRRNVPCIALSNQYALLSPKIPKPKRFDPVGTWFLNNYAPVKEGVGFHFAAYDDNIFTPVIRERIRKTKSIDNGHYTVYLPAYDDKKLVKLLLKFSGIRWHIFSKHIKKPYHIEKISVFPISNKSFNMSMASSHGVMCGAGFGTPSEALYLKKKLLVVPMKNQHEQHFNAASLKQLGVTVLKKVSKKRISKIEEWIETESIVEVNYKETARPSIERVLKLYENLK